MIDEAITHFFVLEIENTSESEKSRENVGVKNPYRYREYRYNTETGLYYLQSRYYNPEWGRVINADAITGKTGELLSHNMFAYCENNPVNAQDSDGHFGWIIAGFVIGGAISAAIEIGAQISSGKSLANLDGKQIGIQALLCALSGAITASGAGLIGAIAGNAAISSAISIISDYVSGGKSIKQIRDSAIENGIIGGIVGAYGGRGAQYGTRIKTSIYTRAYSPINAD